MSTKKQEISAAVAQGHWTCCGQGCGIILLIIVLLGLLIGLISVLVMRTADARDTGNIIELSVGVEGWHNQRHDQDISAPVNMELDVLLVAKTPKFPSNRPM